MKNIAKKDVGGSLIMKLQKGGQLLILLSSAPSMVKHNNPMAVTKSNIYNYLIWIRLTSRTFFFNQKVMQNLPRRKGGHIISREEKFLKDQKNKIKKIKKTQVNRVFSFNTNLRVYSKFLYSKFSNQNSLDQESKLKKTATGYFKAPSLTTNSSKTHNSFGCKPQNSISSFCNFTPVSK